MYVPRRHTRRLLLPPGWVALGFLLLLGCQVLLMRKRQMLPKNVLALNLPPLKSNGVKESISLCGDTTQYFYFSYEGLQAASAAEVNGNWHDFALRDNATDSVELLDALAAIRAVKADTSQAGGVRINFYSNVAYRRLIYFLDSINYLQLQASWLDIRRSPAVFYAVVHRPMTLAERRCYKENECLGTGEGLPALILSSSPTLSQQFINLRQLERRPLLMIAIGSMVLLLSISVAQGLWANPSCRVPF